MPIKLSSKVASLTRMTGLMGLCLALVLAIAASPLSASEGMDEIVGLLQSGVGEEVLVTFVEQSPMAYQPTVDEIFYLRDLGASDTLIQALMTHGESLRLAAAKGEDLVVGPAPEPVPVAAPISRTDPFIGNEGVSEAAFEELDQPADEVAPMTTAVVTTPPPEAVNVSFFYQALAPYGTWRCVDNGWVWQPTAISADRTWRPYLSGGHWVWTDWGWAWHSDYSWGWAPFHYGRWAAHPTYGWVWTPDTTWGPAWVNWRTSNTHLGWAPLPPAARYDVGVGFRYHGSRVGLDFSFGLGARDYCFVPVGRFCEPRLRAYALPVAQGTTVFPTTTLVTNNYLHHDNRIINTGPSVDRIQKVYGRPINQVKIVDADAKPGRVLHGETLGKDKMAVYKPAVAPAAPVTPEAILAKQELAKKQGTKRTVALAQQASRQQAALQAKRDAQKTAAAANTARGEQARQDAQAAEQKAKAAAGTAAREQARKDTATRQDQLETQRKAQTAAEAAKGEQTRRDAQARQDAQAAERKAAAGAETAAREQVRRDAAARQDQLGAQRQAQAAAGGSRAA
ncbi:MAG: hypothetical protein NTW87_20870 [Planctomycetota bacterium]|nr:hypothetical protein [Planctomycetota bacterium]